MVLKSVKSVHKAMETTAGRICGKADVIRPSGRITTTLYGRLAGRARPVV